MSSEKASFNHINDLESQKKQKWQITVKDQLKIKDDLEANIRRRTAEIERTNETLKNEILKRRDTERELRKKERQYRNIIENNADAMVVLNKQGVVQYMNPAAEGMFDRTPEEFVGQSFGFPIISDEMSEIDILRKSGSFVVGEMRSVETEWNGAPAYITTIRDVTLRKEMENQVRKSLSDLEKTMRGTIQAMAKAVEKRDPYTSGHQAQVEKIAVRIAREMELPETFIDGLSMAAMIHDIGKIAIPAEILSKPAQLTDIEFSLIKTHPQVGYDILKNIAFPWKIAETVLQHHERIDGSGYPGGIEKEDILLEARIISVADSLDAIASHRPYRASLGTEFAMSEVLKASGTHYDPDVVGACKRLFDAGSLFD